MAQPTFGDLEKSLTHKGSISQMLVRFLRKRYDPVPLEKESEVTYSKSVHTENPPSVKEVGIDTTTTNYLGIDPIFGGKYAGMSLENHPVYLAALTGRSYIVVAKRQIYI